MAGHVPAIHVDVRNKCGHDGKWRRLVRLGCGGLAVATLLLELNEAGAQPAAPSGTPGATPETAIVLPGIADDFHGVVAEQEYIADHFPTWHIEYQTRITQNDRDYDQLGMIKPDRTKVTIFFDITEWVGK
jgi:hypothetical protein